MIDRRARLRPKSAAASYVYGDNDQYQTDPTLLSMLRASNGLVWNYTPIISEQRNINYDVNQPVHTNNGTYNYRNTGNATITVQGDFVSGTAAEAMYNLACLHFIRSVSLMDFGRLAANSQDPMYAVVGAPPPILLFSAYGRYIYNDIPVILKSYNISYPNDVSYIQVPVDSSTSTINYTDSSSRSFFEDVRTNRGMTDAEDGVWIPQKMSITLQLEEQPTPDFMTKEFNLNAFKRGDLLRKGGFI